MVAEVTRRCCTCKESKPASEFYPCRGRKDRMCIRCKSCGTILARKWRQDNREEVNRRRRAAYAQNPDRFKNGYFKNRYGISIQERNNKLENQNNLCAICGNPENMKINGKTITLSLDHDHKTGFIRDMLCFRCNILVGMLEDGGVFLGLAREYITKHGAVAA